MDNVTTGTIILAPLFTIRAVCFSPIGQRCDAWLPKGRYECKGEVWLDSTNGFHAIMLHECKRNGGTWYVHPDMLKLATVVSE